MAGFRTFATGEVLTAANVNNFLMKQSVMVFADAAARTAALGAEVAEGMLTYNEDTAQLEVFDGSAFVSTAGGGFDDVEVITATNASFPVPALASPIVKVTVIGGGGSGGGTETTGNGGGTTTFNAGGAGTVTAAGGAGGRRGNETGGGSAASVGLVSGNGGGGGVLFENATTDRMADGGRGGRITVDYLDLTGISTVNVTIGAGGAQVSSAGFGAAGGRGEVIVEYKAA